MRPARASVFALPAALGLLAWATFGCRKAAPPAAPPPAAAPAPAPERTPEKPSLMFQGFSARASHNGVVVWEAQAVRARVDHDGQRAHAEDVHVVYFRRGRVVSRARADTADIDLKDYNLKADGSVAVRSSDGVVLLTPHLDWDNRRQRITSSYPVKILRGHTVVTGVGFEGDRDLTDVRILRDVKATAVSVDALRQEAKTWRRP